MLFMINKTQPELTGRISLLARDEDKELLLVGDAVFYATDYMMERFDSVEVEAVYVSKPCLATRKVKVSERCRVVDFDEMVPLIMEDHEKVIQI